MNSILVRRACLALGLAALALASGCASNRKEGPQLNPRVSVEPSFVGTGDLRRIQLEVEVEQKEPYVMRNHTWSVHVWTSSAGSGVLTPGQIDAIMSKPPFASMPDLNARRKEVELDTLEYDLPHRGGYYVVVVAAVEKTKGEFPKVHAVKTYATTIQKGGAHPHEVEIPAFPAEIQPSEPPVQPEPEKPKG